MKTLIYGAGPIGQWLALRLGKAGNDVKLLARGDKLQQLQKQGIVIVDGFTGESQATQVPLVDRLGPEDHYDLVKAIGNEFAQMADEFSDLQNKAGIETPNLDDLLGHITAKQETH